MTRKEFSDGFDTYLNSHSLPPSFGDQSSIGDVNLNEYEKSLFLTQAQEDLYMSLYTGKNAYGESFEATEELRRDLSNLLREKTLQPLTHTSGTPIGSDNSSFFSLTEEAEDELWFIIYEAVTLSKDTSNGCRAGKSLSVYPVRHDEYNNIKNNPFRGANSRRALRLDLADGVIEIVSTYKVASYYLRYLKRPEPIILVDLPDGLTIHGKSEASDAENPCKLHSSLHFKVLEGAVMLALQHHGRINSKTNN